MDYKIVQTKKQKFIAVKKAFSNEIINEADNHDVPDFWDECGKIEIETAGLPQTRMCTTARMCTVSFFIFLAVWRSL